MVATPEDITFESEQTGWRWSMSVSTASVICGPPATRRLTGDLRRQAGRAWPAMATAPALSGNLSATALRRGRIGGLQPAANACKVFSQRRTQEFQLCYRNGGFHSEASGLLHAIGRPQTSKQTDRFHGPRLARTASQEIQRHQRRSGFRSGIPQGRRADFRQERNAARALLPACRPSSTAPYRPVDAGEPGFRRSRGRAPRRADGPRRHQPRRARASARGRCAPSSASAPTIMCSTARRCSSCGSPTSATCRSAAASAWTDATRTSRPLQPDRRGGRGAADGRRRSFDHPSDPARRSARSARSAWCISTRIATPAGRSSAPNSITAGRSARRCWTACSTRAHHPDRHPRRGRISVGVLLRFRHDRDPRRGGRRRWASTASSRRRAQVVGDGPTYVSFDIDSLDPGFRAGHRHAGGRRTDDARGAGDPARPEGLDVSAATSSRWRRNTTRPPTPRRRGADAVRDFECNGVQPLSDRRVE